MPPHPPDPKPHSADAPAAPRRSRGLPPPLPPRRDKDENAADDSRGGWSIEDLLDSSPWLASFLFHAVVLFLLGLITIAPRPSRTPLQLTASTTDAESDAAGAIEQPIAAERNRRTGVASQEDNLDVTPVEITFEAPEPAMPAKAPVAAAPGPSETGSGQEPRTTERARPARSAGPASGGGLEGRNPNGRATLAGRGGGSRQSEAAVERGLNWLVAHQREDGGWSFDLSKPPCNGMCANSGDDPSTTAATALALLPFLAAGYTHTEGEHQETVKRGIYYLSTRAQVTPHGVDLQDGTTSSGMYGQGMATIALCEAYAMTKDPALRDIAQQAIRFIVFAQDTRGGGWRYTLGAPGDTTVTGWQLMALKSGQLAKLDVPSPTAGLVQKFLDSVQFESGARYGYMTPTPRAKTHEATTAVGLLCRMYTGWHRDNPALYQGIAYLHKWGPSENNMYFNYYATQVLHHWEGPEWEAWNKRMRDYLIATQSQSSHEAGSWHFPDPYGDKGGRLYNTALAILTLEIYYRYLPLYGDEAVRDRF